MRETPIHSAETKQGRQGSEHRETRTSTEPSMAGCWEVKQNQHKSLKRSIEGGRRPCDVFPRGGSRPRCHMLLTHQDEAEGQTMGRADALLCLTVCSRMSSLTREAPWSPFVQWGSHNTSLTRWWDKLLRYKQKIISRAWHRAWH